MPQKLQLTFQKGTNRRAGRWKKFYRGKTYYLGNGKCKSDTQSYKEALAKWQQLRVELDAAAIPVPRPYEQEYDEVIHEWELVLSWSVQHGNEREATLAREKLVELRARLDMTKPPPVTHADRLWSRFRVDKQVLAEIGQLAVNSPVEMDSFRETMLQRVAEFPSFGFVSKADIDDLDPLRQAEIKWQDRLENQKTLAACADERTFGAWGKTYLARQQQRVDAGDLSPGRFMSTRVALNHFLDWSGRQADVSTISGQTLTRYHAQLLSSIAAGDCAAGYARDRMSTVRAFIRWLWGQDAIENLPKNIDSRELTIVKRTTTPETFSLGELKLLLKASADRSRLYILLGLNCGMTQKDISDLKQDDVSWSNATITRKRSKTRKYDGVPTVTYQLWPETFDLLKAARSSSETVLVNRNGSPLVTEQVKADGSYRKTDNIKNAYERTRKKVPLSKPFKLLRKTSATLINADERFRGLDQLFLGHAPGTVAAKHYSATSENALDAALEFLRSKYELETLDQELEDS